MIRYYFTVEHATGLTREQWQALDQAVQSDADITVLYSLLRDDHDQRQRRLGRAGGDQLPPNMTIQLANKLEPHATDDTLYVRSLFGLDMSEDTTNDIPGGAQSIAARLTAFVQQSTRKAVNKADAEAGLKSSDKGKLKATLIEDGMDDDPDKQTARQWLESANWRVKDVDAIEIGRQR